jgi:hypothetical protein
LNSRREGTSDTLNKLHKPVENSDPYKVYFQQLKGSNIEGLHLADPQMTWASPYQSIPETFFALARPSKRPVISERLKLEIYCLGKPLVLATECLPLVLGITLGPRIVLLKYPFGGDSIYYLLDIGQTNQIKS